jgi:formyl-CoA transferase
MGALSHIRVLDLTRILAGPWCTQTLADLGADVIKIERPQAGDDTRHWGPPFAKDVAGNPTSEAAYYLSINRNKRSVTLDIASEEGQEILREMVLECDVFVENYKVGQLARYGLGYEHLKTHNPRLIYCSITGFGQTGPYASRPGYDFIVQGMGGFMSITGERDGQPGSGPQKAGVAIADLFTGAHATIAILAALAHREKAGVGQYLDIALLDVQVAMMANMAGNYFATGKAPIRWGNAHPNIVPYQVFPASDGWIIIACGNDAQYRKFVEVGGELHLGEDSRFKTNPDRIRQREALIPLLESMTRRKSRTEWIALLEDAGVPCGPINDLQDVFENPQVQQRCMKVDLPHPVAGSISVPGSALKMSLTPIEYKSPPPLLGEHTAEVLKSLAGLSDQDLETLKGKGIV